jgi:hypothetical protein
MPRPRFLPEVRALAQDTQNDPEALLASALARVKSANDVEALRAVDREFLQKGGVVASLLASIPSLPAEKRRETGQRANQLKVAIETALAERKGELEARALESESAGGDFDPTLPSAKQERGSLHPITQVTRELEDLVHVDGLHGARRAGGRARLVQLRSAQHPEGSPRARFAGHILLRCGRQGRVAHAHVAGASARDGDDEAAVPRDRSGQGVSPGDDRRVARAHVPSDGGTRRRQGRFGRPFDRRDEDAPARRFRA